MIHQIEVLGICNEIVTEMNRSSQKAQSSVALQPDPETYNYVMNALGRAGAYRRTYINLSEVELTGDRISACRKFSKGFQSRKS